MWCSLALNLEVIYILIDCDKYGLKKDSSVTI